MLDQDAARALQSAAVCALDEPYFRHSPLLHAMARGAAALQRLEELGLTTDQPEDGTALAQLAPYWEFEPG